MIVNTWPNRAEVFFRIDVDKFFEKPRNLGDLHIVNIIGQVPQVYPDMFNIVVRI
mgnify:CR=1 FL=1